VKWSPKKPNRTDVFEWHPWFAWRPVDTTWRYANGWRDDSLLKNMVWLEMVERKFCPGLYWAFPIYRQKGESRE